MSPKLPTLTLHTPRQWRTWLAKNHALSPGVWLVFHKKHTGVKSIPYDDAVRDALCFGWIDSLVKRLDDDRYAIKFTPRRPTSRWSDINRKRWSELKAAGLLTAPGLAAAPTNNRYAAPPRATPNYIAKAFKSNPKAWTFFQQLAPGYRRLIVSFIDSAKRPETRDRRIRQSIARLAAAKKPGLN